MITGSFVERAGDVHQDMRSRMLNGDHVLPGPPESLKAPPAADLSASVADRVAAHGAGVFPLARPLSDAEFLAVGSALGTAIPKPILYYAKTLH